VRALSLFSGIGGLDIAAHAVGIETVAFCEIEPFAVTVLERRFPDVENHGDITRFTNRRLRELGGSPFLRFKCPADYDGTIDVVHGGFPCQDLSVAGKQKGLSGERSGLWFEMLRVISELRPAYVLAENVRGACNLALPAVVSGLEGEGYEVRASVVPASAFGAPHRRERLFVLGVRRDVAYAFAERLQRGERGYAFLKQGAPALEPASERGEGSLWPTPSVHGNYNRRGLSESSGDGLATAVRMWATPSSADCKGSHGGGQGRSLRTDIHEIKKMWPTPQSRDYRSSDKPDGIRDRRKDQTWWSRNLNDVASPGGQLSPLWVEILMGYPINWTDPDCDEPEPWPGWPAMMGERLWMTPKAGACGMTAKTKGRPLEMSSHLSAQTFVAERDVADQHPYEPPRTCTGIPNRAKRLKALGNSVVPAQAYPFFEAIAIMEEVRTQCNTASST